MQDHLINFSSFVNGLNHWVDSENSEDLATWAIEELSHTLGFDSAWSGWVNLKNDGAEIHANSKFNLPANYCQAWQEISDQDRLLDKLKLDLDSTATFEEANEEPTEGMSALMKTFNYDKSAVAMNPRHGRLGSFFLATYRSGKHSKSWSQEDRNFLKCSVDQIARAVERSANKIEKEAGQRSVSIYASKQGIGILGLRNLRKQFGDFWPSWKGDELPNRLKQILNMPGHHILSDQNIVAICEDERGDKDTGLRKLILRPLNRLDRLTRREIEVARLLAAGNTHKEVARHLNIAPTTIRNHTQSIYGKLDLDNRASLSALVQKHWG